MIFLFVSNLLSLKDKLLSISAKHWKVIEYHDFASLPLYLWEMAYEWKIERAFGFKTKWFWIIFCVFANCNSNWLVTPSAVKLKKCAIFLLRTRQWKLSRFPQIMDDCKFWLTELLNNSNNNDIADCIVWSSTLV